MRELLAGRRAIETGAFSARWFNRRRALLLLFAHIFVFSSSLYSYLGAGWLEAAFTIILLFFSVYASYPWLLLRALCWSLLLGHGSLTVISMKTVK